jgi:hypothetical protein
MDGGDVSPARHRQRRATAHKASAQTRRLAGVRALRAPSEALGEALTALRIVRSGGHPWRPTEIENRLRALGFEQVETVKTHSPVLAVIGRRSA